MAELYELKCPNCGVKRLLKYKAYWYAKNKGKYCRLCTPRNTKGLEKGHGWNRGLKGYGRWAKWFPKGRKNPAWKGGITLQNTKIRNSEAYAEWRKAVFERDGYTCQFCEKVGGKLHADHITPFCKSEKKRLDVSNGRTLCVSCHRKTDTYGGRAQKHGI